MKRLDRIEVARGLAALAIVFYHASSIVQTPKYLGRVPFGGWAAMGGVGVDFFFVLSGFILYYIHRRDFGVPERLKSYGWKRFLRIYPPYWAATLLVLPVYFVQPGFGAGTERDPVQILSSLTLMPDGVTPILIVGWSLRYEVVFYAVFGLFLWRPRWGGVVMALWMSGSVIQGLREFPFGPAWSQWFSIRNLGFPMGMAAAWWVGRAGRTGTGPGRPPMGGQPEDALAQVRCAGERGVQDPGPVSSPGDTPAGWCMGSLGGWAWGRGLAVLGFGGMLLLGLGQHYGWTRLGLMPSVLLNYLAAGAAVAGLAGVDLEAAARPHRWLRLVGEASYSIYLVHYPVLSVGGKVFRSLGWQAWLPAEGWFLGLSVLGLGSGIVFHKLVEVPLLALRESRKGRSGN